MTKLERLKNHEKAQRQKIFDNFSITDNNDDYEKIEFSLSTLSITL